MAKERNEEQAAIRINEDAPDSPRSPRSERTGAADEGSMEIGKGEPHEDEEDAQDAREDADDETGERRVTMRAEAFNQNDGKGEFSQQREVLSPQYSLGFPGSDK